MDAAQQTLVQKVRALAEQRGWMEVMETADTMLHGDPPLVLAAGPGVSPGPFLSWLRGQRMSNPIVAGSLFDLAATPRTTLAANRVVALLQCGRLLDVETLEAVARTCLNRPRRSYAVVLVGAESVANRGDLDRIERGVWRLLVPGGTADWQGQALREHGCFLWSRGDPPPFLQSRLTADADALDSWLREAVTWEHELVRLRIEYLIALAEGQAERDVFAAREHIVQEQRLRSVRESLADVRTRLLRRIDADFIALELRLLASLQTFEQDLLHNLGAYLEEHLPRTGFADAQFIQHLVAAYLRDAAERWQKLAARILSDMPTSGHAELEMLTQNLDWPLISGVAARSGEEKLYPDALVHKLATAVAVQPDVRFPPAAPEPAPPSPAPVSTAIRIGLASLAAMAATVFLLGGGSASLVTSGGAAMLGSGFVETRIQHGRLVESTEEYARRRIRDAVGTALDQIQFCLRDATEPMRHHISLEFERLETLLELARRETLAAIEGAVRARADLAALAGDQAHVTTLTKDTLQADVLQPAG